MLNHHCVDGCFFVFSDEHIKGVPDVAHTFLSFLISYVSSQPFHPLLLDWHLPTLGWPRAVRLVAKKGTKGMLVAEKSET